MAVLATRETAPRHVWMHAVVTSIAARGFDVARFKTSTGPMRVLLDESYDSGKPVWKGVREMILRLRQEEVITRATTLRKALHEP